MHGLGCSTERGILLDQGLNPRPLLTSGPPGKSELRVLIVVSSGRMGEATQAADLAYDWLARVSAG